MKFYIYKWHSINLLPHWELTPVCDNGYRAPIIEHWLSITLFGFIFNFVWSNNKDFKPRSSNIGGPAWSRRRKKWYMLTDHKDKPPAQIG